MSGNALDLLDKRESTLFLSQNHEPVPASGHCVVYECVHSLGHLTNLIGLLTSQVFNIAVAVFDNKAEFRH